MLDSKLEVFGWAIFFLENECSFSYRCGSLPSFIVVTSLESLLDLSSISDQFADRTVV